MRWGDEWCPTECGWLVDLSVRVALDASKCNVLKSREASGVATYVWHRGAGIRVRFMSASLRAQNLPSLA